MSKLNQPNREALIALSATLKAISRECGNQATLRSGIVTAPDWASLYSNLPELCWRADDKLLPALPGRPEPRSTAVMPAEDVLTVREIEVPTAYGFERKQDHVHFLLAGVEIARDTGLIYIWDIDQSPRINGLPDREGWRRTQAALAEAERLSPGILSRAAGKTSLPGAAVRNRGLIELSALAMRQALGRGASREDEEFTVDARLSLDDPSRPWRGFGAPGGFDPVELLTLGWSKDSSPAAWKRRFKESGYPWPSLITTKVFPGLPLALTEVIDHVLNQDLGARASNRRRSDATLTNTRVIWLANLLAMVLLADEAERELAGERVVVEPKPLTQNEIAVGLWDVWERDFIDAGLEYSALPSKDPGNAIHRVMEQMLDQIDKGYNKEANCPMARYRELVENGQLLRLLEPLAIVKAFRSPRTKRLSNRLTAVLRRDRRRDDVVDDPAVLAAEAGVC